ncbi:MAG: molybdopterin-dependent oxidoreductase, partial [Alphaproteobacteria bacterium]|nr:molybdopterin-dependent oxidoreductase [Alphaproteobacteria bacterium]
MWFKNKQLIAEHKPRLELIQRRVFMKQSLSLGALMMLSGCAPDDGAGVIDGVLDKMSEWNDGVQAALFNSNRLAPTYTQADVVDPFRFNAFYGEDEAPTVDEATYKLQLSGMIAKKDSWTLDQLRALPQESAITRHICVEGWSMIGKWGGVPLKLFLERVGADLTAKYVGFKCADEYWTSLDMPTALHPQTIMALTFNDKVLPRANGFPF